jgi:hypothetical protein
MKDIFLLYTVNSLNEQANPYYIEGNIFLDYDILAIYPEIFEL